jgi:hypothetical protein
MADRNKFEQLLEYIVNGEQERAEELFHSLVVEKSREIYEGLFEEEMQDINIDEASDEEEEEMEEASSKDEEEEEELEEATEEEEDMEESFGSFEEIGGDPADDMMGDVEMHGDGEEGEEGEMGHDEGSVEDRVVDLEDAFADLKAEFDKLMADEEHEPEHHDGEDDPDFGGDDEEGGEDMEDESFMPSFAEDIEEIDLSPAEQMREYVEKIGDTYKGGKVASSSETGSPNTKSIVAKKNDMGGTTANIVKGGTGSEKGTTGGLLAPTTKPQDGGNVNTPGSKNATKLSAVSKGHGAEKKGSGESGSNTKSIIGGK